MHEETVSLPVPARSTMRSVTDVSLHVVTAGDPADPTVVLLHGFPECWYGWHRQIAPLVEAGYHVVVPDQRGYNGSEKPAGIGQYRLAQLVADSRALIEGLSADRVHLAGHDWGAIVAWTLAMHHPDQLHSLGIVNGPHPGAMRAALTRSLDQLRRSWYGLWFQLPWVPEAHWRHSDHWERALAGGAQSGTFDETDIERYRTAWAQPGARTAMLNWYRALLRYPPQDVSRSVSVPTLIIWGEQDVALRPDLATQSLRYCRQGRLEWIPDGSHWILHEYPDRTAQYLLDSFG